MPISVAWTVSLPSRATVIFPVPPAIPFDDMRFAVFQIDGSDGGGEDLRLAIADAGQRQAPRRAGRISELIGVVGALTGIGAEIELPDPLAARDHHELDGERSLMATGVRIVAREGCIC